MRSNRAGRTSKKRRNWICYPIPFFIVKRTFGYRPASLPLSPPVYIPIKLSPIPPFLISQDQLPLAKPQYFFAVQKIIRRKKMVDPLNA